MSQAEEPVSQEWKAKVRSVSRETQGLFAVMWRESPPRLSLIHDEDMRADPEGLKVLFSAYVPQGAEILRVPSAMDLAQLPLLRDGDLLYAYNPPLVVDRLHALQRIEDLVKKSKKKRLKWALPTGWPGFFISTVPQVLLVVGLLAARSAAQAEVFLDKSLYLGIFLVILANLVWFGVREGLSSAFGAVIMGSGSKAVEGYSREKAVAARGDRAEALRLLEDRYSQDHDPQTLKEALRVTLSTPPMKEEGRRLIQELLRLKTLTPEEKERLREELASLGL